MHDRKIGILILLLFLFFLFSFSPLSSDSIIFVSGTVSTSSLHLPRQAFNALFTALKLRLASGTLKDGSEINCTAQPWLVTEPQRKTKYDISLGMRAWKLPVQGKAFGWLGPFFFHLTGYSFHFKRTTM